MLTYICLLAARFVEVQAIREGAEREQTKAKTVSIGHFLPA